MHKKNKIYDDERKDNEIDCKLFSEINDFQNNHIFKSMYSILFYSIFKKGKPFERMLNV